MIWDFGPVLEFPPQPVGGGKQRECTVCAPSAQATTASIAKHFAASEKRPIAKFATKHVSQDKKEGPKPNRRQVAQQGWAVGVPYSAATARNRLRFGGVTQRLCATPSQVSGHTYTHCSFLVRWVARSSMGRSPRRLPGRHSLVAASRCAAGLDLLWGAVPREGRHLGALKVVFCPQAHAGHFS